MRRSFFFLLICFSLTATAHAGKVADLEFNGVRLGQAPASDMICNRGPCVTENTKNSRPIIPVYNKAIDITHYGGVRISSPDYWFYDSQMSRILFRLECTPEKADLCIEAVIEALDRDYGLTLLKQSYLEYNAYQSTRLFLYVAESGAVISIGQEKNTDGWHDPFVNITDKGLMDQMRLFSNPDYVPKEFPRQASIN